MPAPATAELVAWRANLLQRNTTRTGYADRRGDRRDAGIRFGAQPAMTVEAIGRGAGAADFPANPILRVFMGEACEAPPASRLMKPSQCWRPIWTT